jgi:(R,R)-butanediol dehydrogenase/meso-butanediol dehydrogenase/diacetyl reductase
MQAAVFRKAGAPLAIEARSIPDPAPGQVLIAVHRCGICGSDLTMTAAGSPLNFAAGCVPGHEYAGKVVAVGRGVTCLKPGDAVSAFPVAGCGSCAHCRSGDPYGCSQCTYLMGGFAEFAVAAADLCVKLPKTLSLADGALVEPLACGAQAVDLGGVTPQSRVLVLGAGPIGLAAIWWAARAGCRQIVAAAPSRRRGALALEMGATAFLPLDADFAQSVTDAFGGLAPDVVFEGAGKPGALATALDCVGTRGTVVSSGMCLAADSLVPGFATMKQVRLQFSMAYRAQDFRAAVAALDAGHVEPRAMITRTVSLNELPQTLESLRNPGSDCKVLVQPSP